MPDWSATVSAGCIMGSTPGGLFTVCTCMSTFYFRRVLPGTLFHSLRGMHMFIQVDAHICRHILIIYTCNLCPWGRFVWFEHSWLIRTIWTILHTCQLTTDTHTHRGNKRNLSCDCFPGGYSKVFTGLMTVAGLCRFPVPLPFVQPCGCDVLVGEVYHHGGRGGNHSLQYVKGN